MEAQKNTYQPIFLASKSKSIDFMNAYQEQDVDKMLSFCSLDCIVDFIPLGDDGKGKAYTLGKGIWSSLIECFPTIDNTVNHIINEEGNARCDVTIWGKQVKDFAGIISKGKEFEEGHIFIFKVNEEELINHISVNWDHRSFVSQLS